MRSACFHRSLLLVTAACCSIVHAQNNFDELSRRAAAAVDAHPEQAVELYQQALKLRPDWAEGWFYVGASEYQLKRYHEARDAFKRASSLAPREGASWAFLGLSEYELRDYPQALIDLQHGEALGVEGNPAFAATVHLHSALLLIQASQFEPAMQRLAVLVKTGDKSASVLQALGLAGLGIPRLPTDVPAARQEVVTQTGEAEWALYSQGPEEAKPLFEKLVAAYPKEPGVHYAYGVFLLPQDPAAAQRQFAEELSIDGSHAAARIESALLELKAGNTASALSLAREAVRTGPENALAHLVLGRAYLSLGQLADSISELRTAEHLAPGNPQTHFYLEQAYRRAGRREEAQREKAEFDRLKQQQDPLSVTGQNIH